jgi:hypothetical protein
MRLIVAFISFMLTCEIAFAQVSITGEVVAKVGVTEHGGGNFHVVDDNIYFRGQTPKIATQNVVLFRVDCASDKTQITAREVSVFPWATIEPDSVGKNYYEITTPGKWWIVAKVNDRAKDLWGESELFVELGGVRPQPPGPGPNPPGPQPPLPPTPSDDAPIEGLGLRVLFVVESERMKDLSLGQQEIIYGAKAREYYRAHVAKDLDGNLDMRVLDPDTVFSDPSNKFAKAMRRPRSSDGPWVIISNGVTGYEGPMPDSWEEMVLLCDQYQTSQAKESSEVYIKMLTRSWCGWCKKFKAEEAPKLKTKFVEDDVESTNGYPTFIVHVNGKETRLVGFRTAKQLEEEVQRLKGTK